MVHKIEGRPRVKLGSKESQLVRVEHVRLGFTQVPTAKGIAMARAVPFKTK